MVDPEAGEKARRKVQQRLLAEKVLVRAYLRKPLGHLVVHKSDVRVSHDNRKLVGPLVAK